MTMDPTLGMHRIADSMTGSTHQESLLFEMSDQRFNLFLVRDQEFQVVTACEAQVPAAEHISNLADIANPIRTHETA